MSHEDTKTQRFNRHQVTKAPSLLCVFVPLWPKSSGLMREFHFIGFDHHFSIGIELGKAESPDFIDQQGVIRCDHLDIVVGEAMQMTFGDFLFK